MSTLREQVAEKAGIELDKIGPQPAPTSRDDRLQALQTMLFAIRASVDSAMTLMRSILEDLPTQATADPATCQHPKALPVETMAGGPRVKVCPDCGRADIPA